MTGNRRLAAHAAPQPTRSWLPWLWGAVGLVLALALVWAAVVGAKAGGGEVTAQAESDQQSEAETQSSPAEQAQSAVDPNLCTLVFAGDDVDEPSIEAQRGDLYPYLPIPEQEGSVFAGWYSTPEAATNLDYTQRLNTADQVTCEDGSATLNAAWVTPERNAEEDAQIPILMYHWFTTKPEGEDDWLADNYLYIEDFDAHLKYIKEQQFYLPTWPELDAFIDGKLFLPAHSVIITDDDAHPTWYELAVPVVEENQVLTTSFIIGRDGAGPEVTPYVQKRSHSYDMHDAGDNGQGRMVNWDQATIVEDLTASAEQLGAAEVMAYPFGHYNDTAKAALTEAGFTLARTTDYGYVSIGTDKLALPTVRVSYGMGVDALAAAIG